MKTFYALPLTPARTACLLSLAALSLTPLSASAFAGSDGDKGMPGTTVTTPTTFNASSSYTGGNGVAGGDGGTGTYSNPPDTGDGYNAGNGGAGGDGVAATGTTVTIIGGTYTGGTGGNGGKGGNGNTSSPPGGGNGVNGGTGGAGGNALSLAIGATAVVSGGTFTFGVGGTGGNGGAAGIAGARNGTVGTPGANGYSFFVNGGALTVLGTFTGGPQVFTSGTSVTMGSFTGVLANNAGPSKIYTFGLINGGTLTLAPEPAGFIPLVLGGISLAGLGLRARKRCV